MRSLLLFGLLPAFASLTASAQSLEPRAVVPTGGSGESTGTSLSWTLGQPASATFTDGNAFATAWGGGSGSVTITELDADHVEGTFNFKAFDAATETVEKDMTDGKFNVEFR